MDVINYKNNLDFINLLIKNCEDSIVNLNKILYWEKPFYLVDKLKQKEIDLIQYNLINLELEVIKLIRLYVPQYIILDFVPICDYEKIKKVLSFNDYD